MSMAITRSQLELGKWALHKQHVRFAAHRTARQPVEQVSNVVAENLQ